MSQWQNQSWYQNTNQNTPVIKTDPQYAYQIPAQAVAYGRPYVPSDYDSTTMGKRTSPLITNVSGMLGVHSTGQLQDVTASLQAKRTNSNIIQGNNLTQAAPSAQNVPSHQSGVIPSTATIGNAGAMPAGSGLLPLAGPNQLQHVPPGALSSLAPVGGPVVGPMLAGPQGNAQYMPVPVQGAYHPHLPAEYSAYQGANFQLHPDQWDLLAVGLRKPGDSNVVHPAPGLDSKLSKSSASSTTSPSSKNSLVTGGPNPANKVTKRSRMGCLTCRQRKKRCCESKPKCTECLRLGLNCIWPKPGTEHKNKPKEVKREENMIEHDVYGKIRVLRGIVEYRSS